MTLRQRGGPGVGVGVMSVVGLLVLLLILRLLRMEAEVCGGCERAWDCEGHQPRPLPACAAAVAPTQIN